MTSMTWRAILGRLYMMVLVKKHGELKTEEQTFKAKCKKEMGEMQTKLASSELSVLTPEEAEFSNESMYPTKLRSFALGT
jgi:hypothetical protein